MYKNTWWEGPKGQSEIVFTDAQQWYKDQRAQTEAQEIPSEHEEKFPYYESLQVLAEDAQKGWEVSIPGDIKSCTSNSSGWHCLSGEEMLDKMISRSPTPTTPKSLWKCLKIKDFFRLFEGFTLQISLCTQFKNSEVWENHNGQWSAS